MALQQENRYLVNGVLISEEFRDITVANLRTICTTHSGRRGRGLNTKADLYDTILGLDETQQAAIINAVRSEAMQGNGRYRRNPQAVPSQIPQAINAPVLRASPPAGGQQNFAQGNNTNAGDANSGLQPEAFTNFPTPTSLVSEKFMQPPSKQSIRRAVIDFIKKTGNDAVRVLPCAVCASETSAADIVSVPRADILNKELLKPHTPHPKHDIFDGMLLYPDAVDEHKINICRECLQSIAKDRCPKYALANDMWIGKLPRELSMLSFPEKILIAKYFPAAFIFKLYPKKPGAHGWDPSKLYKALKGNVSTYRLDPKQVAGMIQPNVLPPPAAILSSTIGITFLGPTNLPEKTMPNMFRIQRARVRFALLWLKQNNHLYTDITISEANLNQLPEDGVPEELIMAAKHSSDTTFLNEEQDGYVPPDVDEDEEEWTHSARRQAENADQEDIAENMDHPLDPLVMPLQMHGVVDVDGLDISSDEIMAHALANAATANSFTEEYTIRRGSAFVNEYARTDQNGQRIDGGPSDPNHLLGCFPTLFPYGRGGFETDRPINVAFESHAQWTMRYPDKRFRMDPHFAFLVFGVCQKRQVCRSAVLQMKKETFRQQEARISRLTAQDLIVASREETRRVPFSNEGVRALRKQLSAIRTRVVGTDESRQSIRSKIWSTNLICNPPNLWVTINPADIQDPIAQVIAGANIDLDNFINTLGPNSTERATNITNDPYASAKFFHFMIRSIIEELFGISKRPSGRFYRKEGIFGYVKSYIGTVEAQGRGTLHLHLLLWLEDSPSSKDIQEALKQPTFRNKVKTYIESTIRADINKLKTKEVLQTIPKERGLSYSRPPDPRRLSEDEQEKIECKLARSVQLHQCSLETCLKLIQGEVRCKRRAPFPVSPEAWVKESGEWGPMRHAAYLNNWNPTLLRCLRANHDVKLIMNGAETNSLTWYITNYATKKQQRSSNISALLAESHAFRRRQQRNEDARLANKRLIQGCANSLTRDKEFSSPEVMTYLMGWGDRYESHTYVAIYWDSISRTLKRKYPELDGGRFSTTNISITESIEEDAPCTITLVAGSITLKDQLRDYQYRGQLMESMNFIQFMLDTYEGPIRESETNQEEETDENARARRGRPFNLRVPYKEQAGKPTRVRVFRSFGHETLPRFIGKWFERKDDPSTKEMYYASMLVLLKPWTNIMELKTPGNTFEQTWSIFSQQLDTKGRTFIANVDYYYECMDNARARREQGFSDVADHPAEYAEERDDDEEAIEEDLLDDHMEITLTEEDVEYARNLKHEPREQLQADNAMNIAEEVGVFNLKEDTSNIPISTIAEKATPDVLNAIHNWAAKLKTYRRNAIVLDSTSGQNPDAIITQSEISMAVPNDTRPRILQTHVLPENNASGSRQINDARPMYSKLNTDQQRAHDIVYNVLLQHLQGKTDIPQLRMLLMGQGGTGKSMDIGAITETFKYHGQEHILAKCGTTGISASTIGGQTVHTWAGISVNTSKSENWYEKSSSAVKNKRVQNILGVEFLILDEISMLTKKTLYYLSSIMGIARCSEGKDFTNDPFGKIHVIMCGDFHQFPPIASLGGLYYLDEKDDERARIGREIYRQFDTVVILKEQMRVTDQVWIDILNRLRIGECTKEDLDEINKLVLTNPECDIPDFSQPPWDNCVLITPRNAVREKWNKAALRRHCAKTKQILYIAPAEDTLGSSEAQIPLEARVEIAKMPEAKTGSLTELLEIAIGMKIMITANISTDADIANGTRGIVADIVLDPREGTHEPDENGIVRLQYPPVTILFKPDCGTTLRFEGVTPGLVPLTPAMEIFQVNVRPTRRSKPKTYRIRRRQFQFTAGYAFTDYKSQGQTLETVLIDIGRAFSLTQFNAYVALSRSRGRNTIRLLREFNENLFINHPSEALRTEMARLEVLNEVTKQKFLALQSNSRGVRGV